MSATGAGGSWGGVCFRALIVQRRRHGRRHAERHVGRKKVTKWGKRRHAGVIERHAEVTKRHAETGRRHAAGGERHTARHKRHVACAAAHASASAGAASGGTYSIPCATIFSRQRGGRPFHTRRPWSSPHSSCPLMTPASIPVTSKMLATRR